jgi:hypothetical protein
MAPPRLARLLTTSKSGAALTSPKLDRNQGSEVPERFIKFNLMVLTDWEPTSTPHEIALILKLIMELSRCRTPW